MIFWGPKSNFFFRKVLLIIRADFWDPTVNISEPNCVPLVPAPTTEDPVVVLPTAAPYEVKFSLTTTYYWPNLELNATKESLQDGLGYSEAQGPFGFGTGVELDKDKNQVKTKNRL